MAAIPFMPLYVSDYLADTPHLSALEHGAYLLLIMAYWQRQRPLPMDDKKLARMARLTADEWASIKDEIVDLFSQDGDVLRHSRIDAELQTASEKIERARNAGKASAAKRSNRTATPVQPPSNTRSTSVEHPLNHTELDTDKIIDIGSNEPSRRTKTSYPPDFENGLWKPYPNTAGMSKPEALKAWKDLTPDERQQATDRLPAFIKWMAGQGKDYRTLHACRYLSKKRFESLEPVVVAPISGVPIHPNTPQARAWLQHLAPLKATDRDAAIKWSMLNQDRTIHMESDYPPNTRMEAAE